MSSPGTVGALPASGSSMATLSVELPAESAGLLCIFDITGRCGSNLQESASEYVLLGV